MPSELDTAGGDVASPPRDGEAPPVTGEAPPVTGEAPVARPAGGSVHRLRDLDRGGRIAAAGLGLAVALAPLLALLTLGGDWVPAGDNAFIGRRVLDILDTGDGTFPQVGQPSTSGQYGGYERNAFHPGAVHFYLMAPVVQVLGLSPGMIVVSVAITGGSALVAVWAVFRQLGVGAGLVGVAVMSLVTFTTGATSLLNPISSSISGYPLLCSAVLVWCLLCGDDRLLPLAVATISFASLAHLSVGPTMVVLALAAAVGVGVHWGRARVWRDPAARRRVLRILGPSGVIAAVMWAGPLYQQWRGDPGNLSMLVRFASDGDRPSVGPGAAAEQVANALGMPPLLGRTQLSGSDIVVAPTVLTWVSAAAVLVVLTAAGVWWRRRAPRRSLLVVTVGVMVVAGLVNGSSVPDSVEQTRITFYHWVWALLLLATVALVLAAAAVARPLLDRAHRWAPRGAGRVAVGGVLVVAVVPAALNPALERPSNTGYLAGHLYPRQVFAEVADQILDRRDALIEPVVVLGVGGPLFDGTVEGLSLMLADEGVGIVHREHARTYVADGHLLDEGESFGSALLVVTEEVGRPVRGLVGDEIARVDVPGDFDREAFDALVAASAGVDEVVPGPELERFLAAQTDPVRYVYETKLDQLVGDEVAEQLLDPGWVRFLLDHPPERPALDEDLLRRLAGSFPEHSDLPTVELSVRLVSGQELDQLVGD